MNSKISKPIFIIGAPRSGTTLLTELLNQHSKIYIFNETTYYDFLLSEKIGESLTNRQIESVLKHISRRFEIRSNADIDLREKFTLFSPLEVKTLKSDLWNNIDKLGENPSRGHILEHCMALAASMKGKSRWGEKTPGHVFHLKEITSDFPGAKIIHIVRDPRNFLNSYKNAWRRGGNRLRRLYHPIITSLLWKNSNSAVERFYQNNEKPFLQITFEEVVGDTDAVMVKILEFIGEEFEPITSKSLGKNTSFPGRRVELNRFEKCLCEMVCSSHMEKYGYLSKLDRVTSLLSLTYSLFTLPLWVFTNFPAVLRRYKSSAFTYIFNRF